MTPGIFARGTAALESDGVRALLEICAARPAEVDTEETGTPELMYTDLQPDYLNRAMESGRALRLLDGCDGGDDFTSLVCDTRGCYMIPETCPDKENAWSFLRLLLMEGQQLKDFDRRRVCYPSNAAALNAVAEKGLYESNIQTAELNAFCAVTAVLRWKSVAGFYQNAYHMSNCVYNTIDGEFKWD